MSKDSTIFEQPLGVERDEVVANADMQWQAEADCAIEKTGVGLDRRAYFLERCTYQNVQKATVCGIPPEKVEYAFLESALVQVTYQFAKADEAAYGACLQEQALANGFTASNEPMPETEDMERVRLINANAKTGITLGEEREVRVYNAELVPTVHMLRGKI